MLPKMWVAIAVSTISIAAQTAPPQAATVPAGKATPPIGLQAPWDIRQMLVAMNAENEKLKPLFDHMHPQQWIDNGAPAAYASQYLDARSRLDDVIRSVQSLSRQTDSLSVALDAYFRMEALEIVARSLDEGIKKYGER